MHTFELYNLLYDHVLVYVVPVTAAPEKSEAIDQTTFNIVFHPLFTHIPLSYERLFFNRLTTDVLFKPYLVYLYGRFKSHVYPAHRLRSLMPLIYDALPDEFRLLEEL